MSSNPSSSFLGKALGLSALVLVAACGGDKSTDDARGSVGGSPSGGSGGGGTGGGSGGDECVDPTAACGPAPKGTASDTVLYNGALVLDTCPKGIAAPRTGSWFGYSDGTSMTRTQMVELNGRGGATDCAYHAKGSGFTGYGAGVGVDLNYVMPTACTYDGSGYTGLRAQLKGTTSGTRGAGYALTPNSVRIKLVTSDEKVCPITARSGGDDFGGWCTIDPTNWTLCDVPFASATREGFKAAYTATKLDPTKLVKIQFEFAHVSMSDTLPNPPPLDYDVWIDDLEFY